VFTGAVLNHDMSQFQRFALSLRLLASAGASLHRLRQENVGGGEQSLLVNPIGGQESALRTMEADQHETQVRKHLPPA
jgi:hypothetical protein